MRCPSCGAEGQAGRFCAECGAALAGACPSCGRESEPGARYCTACGTALRASSAGGWRRSMAPWAIAAAAALVVVLILFLPDDTERAGPPAMTGSRAAPGLGGGPGRLSADMRVNADRLFNRVMTAAEQGNEAEVAQFMPMAVQAYGMVEDLDGDGIYHLALLHLTAGQYDQTQAAARRLLDESPGHVLALGVAAAAAEEAGDSAAAADLYRRLLESYPAESARERPEYVEHAAMLDVYRDRAQEYLGGG